MLENNMFKEIGDTVEALLHFQEQAIDRWQEINNFTYNQSTIKIKDALINTSVMHNILDYLFFLNNYISDIVFKSSICVDRSRIKNVNSLLSKIFHLYI